MSMYIMKIGSTSHETTPGCTTYVYGKFDSVRKAYAYAIGKSTEFVTNLDIVYDYFQEKAFAFIHGIIKKKSLSGEEAAAELDGVLKIALDKCKEDAFVYMYKFLTPINEDTVQNLIEIYGDTFLDVMLKMDSVIPVEF